FTFLPGADTVPRALRLMFRTERSSITMRHPPGQVCDPVLLLLPVVGELYLPRERPLGACKPTTGPTMRGKGRVDGAIRERREAYDAQVEADLRGARMDRFRHLPFDLHG